MDVKIVKAAARVLIAEIRALIHYYEMTEKLPPQRLDGVKKRVRQLEEMLK